MQINLPSTLQPYIGAQVGPLKAYRFLVEVDGSAVGAFSQFSGIRMEVQTIKARGGNDDRGVLNYIPVLTSYEPVTLSNGVIGDNVFMDWLSSVSAVGLSGPKGKLIKQDLNVVALDDMGKQGVIWTLYNAMPIGYQLSPMDSSRSEILMETVTLTIEGMKCEVKNISFKREK